MYEGTELIDTEEIRHWSGADEGADCAVVGESISGDKSSIRRIKVDGFWSSDCS